MTAASVRYSRPSLLLACALAALSTTLTAESKRSTVDEVARSGLRVATSAGTGLLPIYVSSDWSKPQPRVTRAIVIFHGIKRNAVGYFRIGERSGAIGG